MKISLVDNNRDWWQGFKYKIKTHRDLSTHFSRINQKINDCIVFRMGSETKTDGFVVLSPASLGVTIELVWGESPLFLLRYKDAFIALMKRVDYQFIYARPVSESRRRLYTRLGFVGGNNKLMVMRIK